jgi:hypothetical protein
MKEVPPQDQVDDRVTEGDAAAQMTAAAVQDDALAVDDGCGGDRITTAPVASASITKTSTH